MLGEMTYDHGFGCTDYQHCSCIYEDGCMDGIRAERRSEQKVEKGLGCRVPAYARCGKVRGLSLGPSAENTSSYARSTQGPPPQPQKPWPSLAGGATEQPLDLLVASYMLYGYCAELRVAQAGFFCLPEILLRSEDLPPKLVRQYQVLPVVLHLSSLPDRVARNSRRCTLVSRDRAAHIETRSILPDP